jgi:hypothetical protein
MDDSALTFGRLRVEHRQIPRGQTGAVPEPERPFFSGEPGLNRAFLAG